MSFMASLGKRTARQVGLGLLSAAFAAFTVGCGSSSGNVVAFGGNAPVPPAMQHPRLEGVPIPPGFVLNEKNSYVEKNGGMRHAHMEFAGGLSVAELDRFYRKVMPDAGFTLRNERLAQGDYVLEFENPRESSTVTFKADRKKTILIITLNPTSGGSVAPLQQKSKTQP